MKKLKKAEKVKNLKEKVKELAYVKFVEVQDHYNYVISQMEELSSQKEHMEKSFVDRCQNGTFYPDEIWGIRVEISRMEQELEEIEKRRKALEAELEDIKEELMKKNTDLRMAEVLVEKRKKALKEARLKAEQKEIDERATLMFVRAT
jgi:flagellar export protein FliJ